jgi:hypothetical protein
MTLPARWNFLSVFKSSSTLKSLTTFTGLFSCPGYELSIPCSVLWHFLLQSQPLCSFASSFSWFKISYIDRNSGSLFNISSDHEILSDFSARSASLARAHFKHRSWTCDSNFLNIVCLKCLCETNMLRRALCSFVARPLVSSISDHILDIRHDYFESTVQRQLVIPVLDIHSVIAYSWLLWHLCRWFSCLALLPTISHETRHLSRLESVVAQINDGMDYTSVRGTITSLVHSNLCFSSIWSRQDNLFFRTSVIIPQHFWQMHPF